MCLSCHMLRCNGTLDHELKPHQFLYLYKYVDQNSSVTILATKRSAGVAPEVNLRNSLFTGDEACKQGIHPVFKPYHQTSPVQKKSISGPTKRIDVLQNKFEKSCSFDTQPILCLLPTAREGHVFTHLCDSVHNWPHGYSVTAHPCWLLGHSLLRRGR